MEPEARYALVGTVVLVLVGLIAAALVWLRGTADQADDRRYKIYFERQSLEGLQVRSEVRMKGIRVGSVSSFRISSRRPGAVEVIVSVDTSAPVRQSTQAMVDRHLVTGLATIRLVNPSEDSPLLIQPAADETYPLIAEGESQAQQFAESVGQIAHRVDETLQRVNAILSPDNQRALAQTLKNLERVSADMDRSLSSVAGAAVEVRGLARGLREDAERLAARYDSLAGESTLAVREVAVSVRRLSEEATRTLQRIDAVLASGDAELRVTAQELRASVESLGAVARSFAEPRSILFGPHPDALGPGEARR